MRRLKLTLILLTLLAIGFAAKADVPCETALDRCTMRADTLDSLNAVLKTKIAKQQAVINELQSYSNEQREAITEYLKKYDSNGKRKYTAGEIFAVSMLIFTAICGGFALAADRLSTKEFLLCAVIAAIIIIIDLS